MFAIVAQFIGNYLWGAEYPQSVSISALWKRRFFI